MKKFRFSDHTPAKAANPAKVTANKGYSSANTLLSSAKVDCARQEDAVTLANFSNTLAREETFKINNLSDFSNISKHECVNIQKSCWTCSHLSLNGLPGLCKLIPENKPIPVMMVDRGCNHFKPDTSVIENHVSRLWDHANRMADFTDGSNAPFEERKALVPAIFSIGNTIDKIKGE